MRINNSLEKELEKAILVFEKSERNAGDYINFMMVVRKCPAQGSGLMWSQIKEILEKVLAE